MATHKSKTYSQVTYETRKVASYSYMTVYFNGRALIDFNNSPIKIKQQIAVVEKALPLIVPFCENESLPGSQEAYSEFRFAAKKVAHA